MREPHLRVVDQGERFARLEDARHDHRASRMKHRVGVAVQSAGVKERQHTQKHARIADFGRPAQVHHVPEGHAVGNHGALGPSGGARGVHDGGDIIMGDACAGLGWQRCRRTQRSLIGTARAAPLKQRQPGHRCRECHGGLAELRVVNQNLGCGIAYDETQLRHRQSPVQWHEHCTQSAAGKLQLEEVGAVLGQDGGAIALTDALALQPACQPGDAGIQLQVGQLARFAQVVCSERSRAVTRMVCNPIVGWQAHVSAPSWQTTVRVSGHAMGDGSHGVEVTRHGFRWVIRSRLPRTARSPGQRRNRWKRGCRGCFLQAGQWACRCRRCHAPA